VKNSGKNLPCLGHGTPHANFGTVPGNPGQLATLVVVNLLQRLFELEFSIDESLI